MSFQKFIAGSEYKSRYLVKFHQPTNRYSFYLAGATHQNRQQLYSNLNSILADLKISGQVNYSLNDNVMQDIMFADSETFSVQLRTSETGATSVFIKYNAEPGKLLLGTDLLIHPDGFVDFGLIPFENEFADGLLAYVASQPTIPLNQLLKINGLKFNCWGGLTTLLSLSLYLNTVPAVTAAPLIIPLNSTVCSPMEVAAILQEGRPVVITEFFTSPAKNQSLASLSTFEDAVNYAAVQFCALYLTKQFVKTILKQD